MINFYKPSKINLSIRPLLIASLVVVSNIFNVLIMPLSASAADEGPKYSVMTRTDKTPNLTNQPLTVYFDSKFS